MTASDLIPAMQLALGPIDLNPAACVDMPIAANRSLTPSQGLNTAWKGVVCVVPPYDRDLALWVRKLTVEYASGRLRAGLAVLPARTDSRWFSQLEAAAFCFVRGRLRFGNAERPAPFGSLIAHVGAHRGRFAEVFAAYGQVCVPTGRAAA